jgi:type I restriction enzyme S subunit
MALCDRLALQQQERETRNAALARASLSRFADAPIVSNLKFLFHESYSIPPADLRKSILILAVQGKLVHRIESEGLAADILKQAGVSEEPPEDVPELPTHWIWARLGSIATRMDSGWSPACIPEPAAEGEWGVLKTTAVQTLQYQEVQNKALPPNLEPRPEHEVMDGDILFTRAGPMNRVGILCVARPTRKKLMISDKIIRFHLVVGIDPDFAALSMNAGFSSTVVEGLKSGMAASQVNISQPKLRSVPIPLPPIAEQRRIVAKVEQLMALVDALETQLAASRATGENLLSALVAELTGTPSNGKASVPSASTTGRRGRPRKLP